MLAVDDGGSRSGDLGRQVAEGRERRALVNDGARPATNDHDDHRDSLCPADVPWMGGGSVLRGGVHLGRRRWFRRCRGRRRERDGQQQLGRYEHDE